MTLGHEKLKSPIPQFSAGAGHRAAWVMVLSLVLGSVGWAEPAWAMPGTDTATQAGTLKAHLELSPMLLDYELPGHPNTHGRGHIGAVLRSTLVWRHDTYVAIEAGALVRIPFSQDMSAEAGALPILALVVEPFGKGLKLRLGSLDDAHGYHPALADELRYAYGRPYDELYNRGLVPEARRTIGDDPFMPAEHGAQLIFTSTLVRAEAFLDWQLLETAGHREKFAYGALAKLSHRFGDLGLQVRGVHYGGELFTKRDPLRFMQLDAVRQTVTYATLGVLRPLTIPGLLSGELEAAFVRGRTIQVPGASPAWRQGLEAGADLVLLEAARLGYRLWWPLEHDSGFVSEDGDPIYAGRRSHRARFELRTRHGTVDLLTRLDLVFARGADKVQYETVTRASFSFDPVLGSFGSR